MQMLIVQAGDHTDKNGLMILLVISICLIAGVGLYMYRKRKHHDES